jgi:hypothetical protein
MAELSNFLENSLLDHVLRGTSYTSPTTVYVGLYTSDPGDDNSGTECTGGLMLDRSYLLLRPRVAL